MSQIHFIGTCSGTEPKPNCCHVSWFLETPEGNYCFDAGDGCARHAHLNGVDLMRVNAITISHAHMDHVGGLPELLWTLRKLYYVFQRYNTDPSAHCPLEGRHISLLHPNMDSWQGTLAMLQQSEGKFEVPFVLNVKEVTTGPVFDDGNVFIEAMTNHHLGDDTRSKSYRIFHHGNTIVFSGDVKHISDMEPWFQQPVHLLLMETGHHKVADVCNYVAEHPQIQRLVFIHHGREILTTPGEALQRAQAILGDRVSIAWDNDILPL